MITFQNRQFNIPDKCDKCTEINDIVKLQGGEYSYFCGCFPLRSIKIKPFIPKVVNLKTRAYR